MPVRRPRVRAVDGPWMVRGGAVGRLSARRNVHGFEPVGERAGSRRFRAPLAKLMAADLFGRTSCTTGIGLGEVQTSLARVLAPSGRRCPSAGRPTPRTEPAVRQRLGRVVAQPLHFGAVKPIVPLLAAAVRLCRHPAGDRCTRS